MYSAAQVTKALNGLAITPKQRRPRRKRRARSGPRTSVPTAAITISRSEVLETMVAVTQDMTYSSALSPHDLPWLSKLAAVFQCWQVIRAEIEWRPAVGTTVPGMVTWGFDWMSKKAPSSTTRNSILALTPVVDSPVWKPARMVLPVSRLQTRKWYSVCRLDKGKYPDDSLDFYPGYVLSAIHKNGGGELWLHYTVKLFGTEE